MEVKVKNVLWGVGLVVIVWIVSIFFAFVIFSSETEVKTILPFWLITNILIIVGLVFGKFLNLQTLLFTGLTIVFLVGMYLIPINNNIPESALDLNSRISDRNDDRFNYAEELFFEVEKKWTSQTREYLRKPNRVFFLKDFTRIWDKEGYIDSSLQIQAYRKLLLQSGRFTEDEVIIKNDVCTNSPHRYLHFKDTNHFADLWSVDHFEEYEFGMFSPQPCGDLEGDPFP